MRYLPEETSHQSPSALSVAVSSERRQYQQLLAGQLAREIACTSSVKPGSVDSTPAASNRARSSASTSRRRGSRCCSRPATPPKYAAVVRCPPAGYDEIFERLVPPSLQPYFEFDIPAMARDLQLRSDLHILPAADGGVWIFHG